MSSISQSVIQSFMDGCMDGWMDDDDTPCICICGSLTIWRWRPTSWIAVMYVGFAHYIMICRDVHGALSHASDNASTSSSLALWHPMDNKSWPIDVDEKSLACNAGFRAPCPVCTHLHQPSGGLTHVIH